MLVTCLDSVSAAGRWHTAAQPPAPPWERRRSDAHCRGPSVARRPVRVLKATAASQLHARRAAGARGVAHPRRVRAGAARAAPRAPARAAAPRPRPRVGASPRPRAPDAGLRTALTRRLARRSKRAASAARRGSTRLRSARSATCGALTVLCAGGARAARHLTRACGGQRHGGAVGRAAGRQAAGGAGGGGGCCDGQRCSRRRRGSSRSDARGGRRMRSACTDGCSAGQRRPTRSAGAACRGGAPCDQRCQAWLSAARTARALIRRASLTCLSRHMRAAWLCTPRCSPAPTRAVAWSGPTLVATLDLRCYAPHVGGSICARRWCCAWRVNAALLAARHMALK